MSARRGHSILRKNKIQNRTHRILALVPVEHAPSDTSDKSENNSDNEFPPPSPSPVSSSAPSINSSLERLDIYSSPEPEHTQNDDEQPLKPSDLYHSEALQLTPVLQEICPHTPSREPNYDNVPSLSSIISLPSEIQSPTPCTSYTRKTRSKKQIAPAAKKSKKIPKFSLSYKWKKGIFRHRAVIEERTETYVDFPDDDPLDYLYLFFSEDIFTDLVDQTNLYSVQQTGRSIQASENEMRDFISIHILMGIVEMPCYLDYWSNSFRYGQIADIMTLKRYQQIRRFLHFSDNNLQDSDRYYKVRPIAEKIRRNCLKQENENKFSIDEMMIPYKGRKAGNRKQYMKDKPNKWGFKNYVRAGVSGMIYDFVLYAGEDTFRSHKFTEQESSLGFGAKIVIALTQTIQKKPATIFCDNFFSSPELFYLLKQNYGVFGLGTIRSNRIRGAEKFLPDENSMKKKQRGTFSQVVCNANKLVIVRWSDNKPVTLISSFVGSEPVQKIKRYCKEQRQKIEVDCPQIVCEYNKHMGGVDLADMLISLYKVPFKTRSNCINTKRLGGVMVSTYRCTSGCPGFETRVGPSLVIASFSLVNFSNSSELGSWLSFTLVHRRARKAVSPASYSHWSCRSIHQSMRVTGIESALVSEHILVHYKNSLNE
ncbi:unnamed protein product, partial [Brenthis ino]